MSIKPEKPYKDILFEVKDQVAWITINRPRVLNAFREQTLDEMIDAVKLTREDPSIACIVFTGAGDKAFSAGGDFYAMKRLTFTNGSMWNDRMLGLAMAIRGVPIPAIAMVNGWCFGGAFQFLCACDMAVAADDATFGLSEINWGIIPAGIVSKALIDCLSYRDGLYLALTGKSFSAKKAEEIRLINKAVPAADLRPGDLVFFQSTYAPSLDPMIRLVAAEQFTVVTIPI